MLASRQPAHAFETAQGHRAKNREAKISQEHFMVKILFLH
jgi:hypothetical protein